MMSWFDAENENMVFWRVKVIHWIVFINVLLSLGILTALAVMLTGQH